MVSAELLKQYSELRNGNAFVWHDDRTLLRFTGPDAAKFLHNFCTADVNAMQVGQIREAFVLDSRGKTLSFGHILKFESEIFWSAADKSHATTLADHFEKYMIREQVTVENQSEMWCSAIEPLAAEFFKQHWASVQNRCSKLDPFVTAVAEFAGPSRLHLIPRPHRERWIGQLAELAEASIEGITMLRLESGTPWFGAEVDENNLPQELRRDSAAISFHKGCYLGQETVAKIDSIGHVNRLLVGLIIECNDEISTGPIIVDGKKIGELRSVGWSPVLDSWLGLGFVKRSYAETGTAVEMGTDRATVVSLPIRADELR